LGQIQPRRPNPEWKTRAPVPALADLHKGPRCFDYSKPSSPHYYNESLTVSEEPLRFYSFTRRDPRRRMASHRAPTSSRTGQIAQRLAPYFGRNRIQVLTSVSPVNFKNGYPIYSGHDDSGEKQRNNVFPTIHGGLVQSEGSRSLRRT
jgi:hypothetical protein